jgi:hypothetical protein
MPTDDQLNEALEHIKYEVDMVNGLSAKLTSGKPEKDVVLRNACLESMAIHLRSLESFLRMKKPKEPDDVFAKRYVGSYSAPAKNPANDAAREYANKCVAHQTFKRIHDMPFEWPNWLAEIRIAYNTWRSSIRFGQNERFKTDPGELNPASEGEKVATQTNLPSAIYIVTSGPTAS